MNRTGSGCINLLMDTNVRKELNLDLNQIAELDAKIKVLVESQAEITKIMQGASKQAIDVKKFVEVGSKNKELLEETEESLTEILDPMQVDLLAKKCVEQEGSQALVYLVVADRLKLTSSQRQKIARIRTSSTGLSGSKPVSGMDTLQRMRMQKEKSGEEFMAVLTDQQEAQFNSFKKKEVGSK